MIAQLAPSLCKIEFRANFGVKKSPPNTRLSSEQIRRTLSSDTS